MAILPARLAERVVAVERVRRDAERLDPRVVRQRLFDRRRGSGRALRLIEHVRDRLCRERAAPERVGDRRVEGVRAESIEESEQA